MTPTQQLQAGIQALGLDLSAEQQTHLLAYTDLLKKWNKTYNLTALRDEAQMVSHHLLDSLTLLPYLGLANVRVVSGRVEAVQDFQADIITSRAFAELADFVNWTAHLLKDGGRWVAMKGVYPEEEIAKLPDTVAVECVEALHVPGLDAERHMVVLKKV